MRAGRQTTRSPWRICSQTTIMFVPLAPPSWRMKFMLPEPLGSSAGVSALNAVDDNDGRIKPSPARLITAHKAKVQKRFLLSVPLFP